MFSRALRIAAADRHRQPPTAARESGRLVLSLRVYFSARMFSYLQRPGISPRRYLRADTALCPNVRLMLGQHRRQWPNINPTLGQSVVFAGRYDLVIRIYRSWLSLHGRQVCQTGEKFHSDFWKCAPSGFSRKLKTRSTHRSNNITILTCSLYLHAKANCSNFWLFNQVVTVVCLCTMAAHLIWKLGSI